MTMAEVRAAALGEFPAPPPCPPWCERDNDTKTRTTWRRTHMHLRSVTVTDGLTTVDVYVVLTASDTFYGDRWESRSIAQIELGPAEGTVFGDADSRFAVAGLLAVARLIAPEVQDAVRTAAAHVSSPAVTPAGEDQ